MKALTVWQPWASLIAIGAKPYEFRSWRPHASLIGQRIAIHAGARPVQRSEVRALIWSLNGTSKFTSSCLHKDLALPLLSQDSAVAGLLLSHVLCTAVVGNPIRGDVAAREFGVSIHSAGDFNWAWPMLDVRPLEPPQYARGRQGLWDFVSDLGGL